MVIGSNTILGGYVGSAPLVKAYLGSNLVFGGNTPSLPSGYTQIADGVRSSSAPYWDLNQYIDTGIYVTGDPEVRIKYIGGGVFSDRIFGFDANETGDDNTDFRWFPHMADAAAVRLEPIPTSYYDQDVAQDITFGNIYAFDNISGGTIDSNTPSGTIDSATTIRIDMSCNWIQELQIKIDGTTVWNGVACYDETNQEYGMFDLVSQTMFTSNNCTVIGNV